MLCSFQIRFPTGQALTSRNPGMTSSQRGKNVEILSQQLASWGLFTKRLTLYQLR